MRKIVILSVVFGFLISIVFVSYAGIRVKPHDEDILNPNLTYIISETVVEDGRLVSDKTLERRLIGVKEVSHPTPSKVGKVLHKWGVGLLDMFVCNMYVD